MCFAALPKASATIGENLEESKTRYGEPDNEEPVQNEKFPGADIYRFTRASGLSLWVILKRDKTVAILYEHPDWQDLPLNTMVEEKIPSILKSNYEGEWSLDTDTSGKMMAQAIINQTAGAGDVLMVWATKGREHPLLGFYTKNQGRLVVGQAEVVGELVFGL